MGKPEPRRSQEVIRFPIQMTTARATPPQWGEMARVDRPHRPPTRGDPKLLPMSRAAELLGRSTRGTRCERPATPQAVSFQGFLGRFECCDNREAAAI